MKGAADYHADVIVTVCPMCQLNLDAFQGAMNRYFKSSYHMPVLYFTQMMGLAFGQDAAALGIGAELVDARPALAKIGVELPPPVTEGAPKRKRDDKSLPMPKMSKREPAGRGGGAMKDQARIGVYVCHCGSNIAGMVDVEDVATWAGAALPNVVVARDYKFMCSSLGQELIEKDIKEQGLNRVVVAACSPHLHEATFRNACQRAGLNPYLFDMVSIREQVSWVTTDRAIATEKAKALISGGVHRVVAQ